ncbi:MULTISPECIES: cell wall-binding repeat-containing protein [unclassified Dehalobacter]|uniref:cell wall-binding repeat-containing protein n=2 Tax=Dehalobacter TaxID=56112 RepID=UPI000E6B900C|nr:MULTISPECIES: cell wall-binding repeat-containing protein [unclassified Dehalobacter]RJE47976.1 trypsin [Dehalobacter sp. MCB1]TCX50616.1 trypsin [Dehalobacter sp. 14DCB1]TCX52140.1 trypsin [Dehalobacter sp. 12DCB1]
MKRYAKQCLSVMLTLILCLGAFVPEALASTIPTHRISGDTRYTTAANIAKEGWSGGSQWAIIACGSNFPDALASTPLAAKYNAPILLTEKDSLTAVTRSTLTALGTKNVYIVGGPAVVSTAVETQLKSMGISVTRLSGSDRYYTSVEIAKRIGNTSGMLVVAPGGDYPNALSISSYAGKKQIPMILVDKSTVSESLEQYIANNSIQQTYVIGNTAEINDSVFNALPSPTRIQGSDRYATNLAVLKAFEPEYAFDNTFLATGNNFADALAGSSYAAKLSSPIILTGKTSDSRINNYLAAISSSITQLNILGGEAAISSSLVNSYLGIETGGTLTAKEIFAKVSPSIVYIETYDSSGNALGSGSGFIVDSSGKVATNYHVIEGSYSAKVKTAAGTSYDVQKVLSYNETTDLAILKISATGLTAVSLGDSSLIETGDNIYAIGNPFGLENTLSNGLISTKFRDINGTTYIQISAPISSGSSGGALVDEQGKVIGITAAVYYGGQNLNFAVPINLLKPMLLENINKTLPEILPAIYSVFANMASYIQNAYGTNVIAGQTIKYSVTVTAYQGNTDTSHDGSAFIVFTVTPETDAAESDVLDNHSEAYLVWLEAMLNDLQTRYGPNVFNGGMYYGDSFYILFDNWDGYTQYWY